MYATIVFRSIRDLGRFHFCAYGLQDPESGLRSLKPTSLMHCLPSEVMRPIFRRCKKISSSVKHEHQPLEGNAGTFGSRTKLAQVYPYQFCQDLAHIILRHLQVKPLDNEVYLLEDLFEPFTIKQVDILRKEMEAIDKEFNMTSSSLAVRIQDLPFNKDVQPLVTQDPLVQKFQKTMKQYPPGTEIDIFKQDPNDWRCQNMWNGCKKLRQLCISSTQYDACTAYVRTIGINMPITSPPDDAIISFWQPDQLNRIWVLPASKCNWEKYDPKTWHAVMFISRSPMRRPSGRCPSRRIHWIRRMHLNNLTHSSHLINRTIPCLTQDLQHLRTSTCQILLRILHISLIIPCRQHHAVCRQTVQWILHYRHTTSLAEEMQRLKRQKQSISSSSGLNRLGVMSLCRHSRNHLSQFFRLSWYLHHLRFLQIPKQKNKMKILNCQHLRKKKQPAVHQRSRRLGKRRRSQMTMMSHLSILPDMILHLHPIIIRTIQRICRSTMKVRKN